MRAVLSGYFGHGNLGDEAVLAGLLAAARAADPHFDPVVISADVGATRSAHGVDAVGRTAVGSIWRALRGADGLISGGGGLLQDRTSARPVAYYTGVMGLARLAGRPYVVHAQGLGPVRRRANRALTAAALRGAAHVSLRDEGSVGLARELGVRRGIDVVPDPALALVPERAAARHVILAVRSWGDATGALRAIGDAARELASEEPVLVLPMHEPLDREPSRLVAGRIPGATVVDADAPMEERLRLIGSASLVIGMRLHALVLAAAAGVPAVAISYDPKVDAFASRVGMPVAGAVDASVDPAAIVAAARGELAADLTQRNQLVREMRAAVRTSVGRSLAALLERRARREA